MSEIAKTYEPAAVEAKWYEFWLQNGCFTADPARVSDKRPAYSIVIPPPNVTGVLTLGHVLNNTIQDILARRARMLGKEVLWLPGTDHAGIATQTVVERTLKKQGVIRHRDDLGREKFLEKVWEWKEKHGGIIIQQLKKLGASCDWSRERFTMDPEYSQCVARVFVDLYKKGLIYRGKRMVNWDPVALTALSDEEVNMKPQNGAMYHFKVEVVETGRPRPEDQTRGEGAPSPQWLTIATTRPETIPGDTAVAVNPKDSRYAHLIGKHVIRPLPHLIPREQKLIPIVGDDAVDFEFGTGVLKVTPAHDKADFEIGQRHSLPIVDIMNPDGTMNALAGESLVGLDRFEARNVAVERLRELSVLVKEEPYQNNVGFSERTDVPIEPRLSEQWFLKYPSVEQARACVSGSTGGPPVVSGGPPETADVLARTSRNDAPATPDPFGGPPNGTGQRPVLPGAQMRFYPERWAKVYDHWMSGIQDWCISRQLWWGHRVPVWRKRVNLTEGNWTDELLTWGWDSYLEGNWGPASVVRMIRLSDGAQLDPHLDPLMPVVRETEGEYDVFVCTVDEQIAAALEHDGFTQDPDVLDTWFSSWLWPFATMGWPEKTDTLAKFYPTTDLVTGPDIIFFWVARMIMAGFEYMGELPFRNVYFTGIIRDKQGRKMSKSLGNSPDPLDLIAKYGADALRFGVMRSAPLGADILFDEKNVELGRNFCTKLWNATRFRQMQGGGKDEGGRMKDEENGGRADGNDASATLPPPAPSPSSSSFIPHPSSFPLEGEIAPALLTSDDRWILARMDDAVREVTAALEEYRFSDAANALYRFFWSEFCDWYLEAAKAALAGSTGGPPVVSGGPPESPDVVARTSRTDAPATPDAFGEPPNATGQRPVLPEAATLRANTLAVIDFVLGHTLRLFHPFLPFITEELWQSMGFADDLPPEQGGKTIMTAPWPKAMDADERAYFGLEETAEAFANAKYEVVNLGRGLRRDFNIASNKRVRFVLRPNAPLEEHDAAVLRILLNAEPLEVLADYAPAAGTPTALTPLGELYLPLEGLIDLDAERERMAREIAKVEAELEKVRAKLADPNFSSKVPAKVLDEHRQREAAWAEKLGQLIKMRAGLG